MALDIVSLIYLLLELAVFVKSVSGKRTGVEELNPDSHDNLLREWV